MIDLFRKKYSETIKLLWPMIVSPFLLGCVLFISVYFIVSQQMKSVGSTTVNELSEQAASLLNNLESSAASLQSDGLLVYNLSNPSEKNTVGIPGSLSNQRDANEFISHIYFVKQQGNYIYSDDGIWPIADADMVFGALLGENSLPESILSDVDYPQDTSIILSETDALRDASESDSNDNSIPFHTELLDLSNGWHSMQADNPVIYYVSEIYSVDGSVLGTSIFILDNTQFRAALSGGNQNPFWGIYDNEIALCSDENITSAEMIETLHQVNGKRVRLFYMTGENYTFVSGLYINNFYRPLYILFLIFGLYFLGCLIFTVFNVRYTARRQYQQISGMISEISSDSDSTATYGELLASIQQSMETYRNSRQTYMLMLKNQERRLLLQESSSTTSPSVDWAIADLPESCFGYCVANFIVRSSGFVSSPDYQSENDVTAILLEASLQEYLKDFCQAGVVQIEKEFIAILCMSNPDTSAQKIKIAIQKAISVIEESYGSELYATISNVIDDYRLLPEAFRYTQSLHAFKRTVNDTISVLSYSDMTEDGVNALLGGSYLEKVHILLQTIKLEKYELVSSMVDVIIDEHISSKRQTFYDFIQLRLDSLKGLLAESMFSTPLDKEIQLHDSRELIQARSVEDLSHITHRIFDEELPLPKENEDDDITNTIYNYIHAHYQNPDLSIPEISNAVGYSVQYISKIFRQNSGITMVDYINKYRINQAIQFLGEGKTVSEIQQLTGFNSNVTFSRNFHKYTGLSPSEYRKIHFH